MFHVELRQFPHLARAFNLSREELEGRILRPWLAGSAVELNDRRWSAERARLKIFEGPELRLEELGLGRGWANATRAGEDVTERVIAEVQPPASHGQSLELLKREILARASAASTRLTDIARLAESLTPGRRASEGLALVEQAVWELLHRGLIRLTRGTGRELCNVGCAQWQEVLLSWDAWAGGDVFLDATSTTGAEPDVSML